MFSDEDFLSFRLSGAVFRAKWLPGTILGGLKVSFPNFLGKGCGVFFPTQKF